MMLGRADDLAPLLFPPPTGDIGFHSGVIQTWDSGTGANTVEVAGAVLVNVPILNTAEAITLQPGHVVAMLRYKSSYFILGRVTVPGESQFASASVAFGDAFNERTDFAYGEGTSDVVSASIDVPPWANEALVMCVAMASVFHSGSDERQLLCGARIEGQTSAVATQEARANFSASATSTMQAILNPAPGQIEVACQAGSALFQGGFARWGANNASVNAIAVFRSTA